MAVNYKPENMQSLIPYLIVPDAEKELAFMKEVFGGKEGHIKRDGSGRIGHAEVKIGDCTVMLAEATPQWPALTAAIYIYVRDIDAAYQRALALGATSVMKPADQFYGDRNGGVTTSNGVQWWIATHIEDVSSEELERRASQKPAHV